MKQKNYHYISLGRWQSWFLGGKKHSNLFEYMCLFYDVYFESHDIVIDYFLTDDAIAYFFTKISEFLIIIKIVVKVIGIHIFLLLI